VVTQQIWCTVYGVIFSASNYQPHAGDRLIEKL